MARSRAAPGDLSLQIALGGTDPIQLNLLGARVLASTNTSTTVGSISGTSVTGGVVFAGAITSDDINNKVIPQVAAELGPVIAKDCTMLTMPPDCGCPDGSTGKTILGLFDTNKDCMVTSDEIKNNSLIMSLLAPDVTVEGKQALSLGIKAILVGASYTAPNETM